IGDVVDHQQPLALDRLGVEHRGEQHGIRERLVDIGVELDVDRVGELQAERVGEGAGRQQPAAGDRDDDLRIEVQSAMDCASSREAVPNRSHVRTSLVTRSDESAWKAWDIGALLLGCGARRVLRWYRPAPLASAPAPVEMADASDSWTHRTTRTHTIQLLFSVVYIGSLSVIAMSATLPTVRPPTKQVHRCTPGN